MCESSLLVWIIVRTAAWPLLACLAGHHASLLEPVRSAGVAHPGLHLLQFYEVPADPEWPYPISLSTHDLHLAHCCTSRLHPTLEQHSLDGMVRVAFITKHLLLAQQSRRRP